MGEKGNEINSSWEKEIDNSEVRTDGLGNLWYGYEGGKKIETSNGKTLIKEAKIFLKSNQNLDPLLFRILLYNIKYYLGHYYVKRAGDVDINDLRLDFDILRGNVLYDTKNDLKLLNHINQKKMHHILQVIYHFG